MSTTHKMLNDIWNVELFLDNINISDNLTNTLRIEAEEGTAKVAEFSLIPNAGPISVTKWIGKSVKIFYQAQNEDFLLFDGVVDEPIYDRTTKITTFSCTDQLQERIQRSRRSEIDDLIQGHWSSIVFENTSDNWIYAQDQLSTLPTSLDLSRDNLFQLTPWKAKKEPDYVFTEDDVLYQSIQVQLANRREIHNQVNILYQYRYQRLKQREIHFDYRYPLDFCEQNYRNATLPNVEMIQQAIAGTNWLLKNKVEFEHQRGPGWVTCGDVKFGFMIKEEIRQFLVREARFVLAKRFTQTVTEHYQLQLHAPQSISQLGEITSHDTLSFEVPAESDKFVNNSNYQPPILGSITDNQGEYVFEVEDRGGLNHAIQTKINQAKTAILKSHRNNLISFKTPLHPSIERHHTVKLDLTHVKAQGKVKHIVHECDFNQGSCQTTITIAVSRTDNDDIVNETGFMLPVKDNQWDEMSNPIKIFLPSNLGGKISSPVYDETWDGYTGNEKLEPNVKPYPERFAITVPAIEEAQQPISSHINYKFDIVIPNELILLTA